MITKELVESLTGGEITGRGMFDELMRAVDAHVQREHDADRITPQNYATVYLGALQAVLGTSSQYVLSASIAAKNELILDEQLKQNERQNQLLDLQIIAQQIANDTARYNLDTMLPQQYAQLVAQTNLTTEQLQTQIGQTALVNLQDDQLQAQIALTAKQEDLLDEQIKTENANTTDASVVKH